MDFINGQHIQATENTKLEVLSSSFVEAVNGGPLDVQKRQRVARAMETLKPRAKTLKQLAEQAEYLLVDRPINISGKSKKSLKPDALEHLQTLILMLRGVDYDKWTADSLQHCIQTYAAEAEIGFGKIGQPLRAALTGGLPSPDLSWVLFALGRDETLGRISDVLEQED